MSGRQSRARRVEAVNRAKEALERSEHSHYSESINPYSHEEKQATQRQHRIFKKYYEQQAKRNL